MDGTAPKARANLRDVAKLAGVSVGTASLVLNGKGASNRISEDTHRKVLAAAASLDYTPSLLHRSARQGRTHILSFYNGLRYRNRGDHFMDRLSTEIEYSGGRYRYNVLVQCDFAHNPRETYEFLVGGFCDGVVMFSSFTADPLVELLRGSALPVVLLSPDEPESVLSSVSADENLGLIGLADALYDGGHRHVAGIVADWPGYSTPYRRFATVRERLLERGATMEEKPLLSNDRPAREVLRSALALPKRPTALFVWHDRMAYRLLDACAEEGVEVPGDLSIVSVDGMLWPTATPHVVTSVAMPLEELAEAAVSTLARLVEGERGPITVSVPVSLNVGTTLGPPRFPEGSAR